MTKTYCMERKDALMKIADDSYVLMYGGGEDEVGMWQWRWRYDHRPSDEQMRADIEAAINAEAEERIRQGLRWQGAVVWLSMENQLNYKAAHDLALQTNGANLPVTMKFGDDGAPVYHTFADTGELTEFMAAVVRHITDVLAWCWAQKDGIVLPPLVEP